METVIILTIGHTAVEGGDPAVYCLDAEGDTAAPFYDDDLAPTFDWQTTFGDVRDALYAGPHGDAFRADAEDFGYDDDDPVRIRRHSVWA